MSGFYVLNADGVVSGFGCRTELEAKRQALQNIGRIKYESLAEMRTENIDKLYEAMERGNVKIVYSNTPQKPGTRLKISSNQHIR